MENILDKKPLKGRINVQVYYEDTDLSGFVYHANYLKYFERAREHVIGVSFLRNLWDQDLHFVVSNAQLSFLAPCGHGDLITIVTEGEYSHSPAIPFTQTAYKSVGGNLEKCVVGQVTIVALNRRNRPIRLPNHVIEHFTQTQSRLQQEAQA